MRWLYKLSWGQRLCQGTKKCGKPVVLTTLYTQVYPIIIAAAILKHRLCHTDKVLHIHHLITSSKLPYEVDISSHFLDEETET